KSDPKTCTKEVRTNETENQRYGGHFRFYDEPSYVSAGRGSRVPIPVSFANCAVVLNLEHRFAGRHTDGKEKGKMGMPSICRTNCTHAVYTDHIPVAVILLAEEKHYSE